MKLIVRQKEILDLLSDQTMYAEDCGHGEYDECCCHCSSKRVLKARKQGELIIDNKKPDADTPGKTKTTEVI